MRFTILQQHDACLFLSRIFTASSNLQIYGSASMTPTKVWYFRHRCTRRLLDLAVSPLAVDPLWDDTKPCLSPALIRYLSTSTPISWRPSTFLCRFCLLCGRNSDYLSVGFTLTLEPNPPQSLLFLYQNWVSKDFHTQFYITDFSIPVLLESSLANWEPPMWLLLFLLPSGTIFTSWISFDIMGINADSSFSGSLSVTRRRISRHSRSLSSP